MLKCQNQTGSWKEFFFFRKQVRYPGRLKGFLPLKNWPPPFFFFSKEWYLLSVFSVLLSSSFQFNITVSFHTTLMSWYKNLLLVINQFFFLSPPAPPAPNLSLEDKSGPISPSCLWQQTVAFQILHQVPAASKEKSYFLQLRS